jgi:FtsH-binding integral membrane protein
MNPNFGTGQQASFGRAGSVPGVTFDAGLRQYMLGIYNNMSIGLLITALTAWFAGNSPAFVSAMFAERGLSGLGWLVTLAPIGFILVMSFGGMRMSSTALRAMFFVFSALMGLSLFSVVAAYTAESIARTFFITAGTFAAVSLWGYTTKRDLTGMGHFMIMGLFGLIIASVVNVFVGWSALQFAISVVGVVIFTGLTAWDTQRAKEMYAEQHGIEANSKLAIMSALSLYMNFINMFLYLLRFFGQQRE